MPIVIQTYLTAGRVEIGAADAVDDPDYAEGFIDLQIDGIVLMDRWLSDAIAMLWSTMIDGLEALVAGQTGRFQFPDQPIPVVFQPIGRDRVLVSLTIDGERRAAQAERGAFVRAALAAGRHFFTQWLRLAPDDAGYANAHLERIATIEAGRH